MSIQSSFGFLNTTPGPTRTFLETIYPQATGIASNTTVTFYTSPVLPAGVWSFFIYNAVYANTGNITQLSVIVNFDSADTLGATIIDITNNDTSINIPISFIGTSDGVSPFFFKYDVDTSAGTWGYIGGKVRAVRVA